MVTIGLAILFPVLSVVLFKLFAKFKVYIYATIVLNYVVAASICYGLFPNSVTVSYIANQSWLPFSFLLGVAFIVNFFLIGKSANVNGISYTTLANKISLVIPVLLGVLISSEGFSWAKVLGLGLALLAIYFVTLKQKGGTNVRQWWLLILVFFLTGIMEYCLGYVEQSFFSAGNGMELFIMTTFGSAFLIGVIPFVVNLKKVGLKELLGGIALGTTNGLGVYYLFKALSQSTDNGVVFSIVNLGGLLLATLVGWGVFKEKLSVLNGVGIMLAMIAIYLFNSL